MKRIALAALPSLAVLLTLACSGDHDSEDQPSMTDVLGVQSGIQAAEDEVDCLYICKQMPPVNPSGLVGVQRTESMTFSQEVVDRCEKIMPCQARARLR